MTDAEWVAMWVRHCAPVALFVHHTATGYQYIFLPLLRDECEDCGLRH